MDPWHWTVDDVVAKFCQSRDIWADWPHAKLPNILTLEETFRKNAVDGATLLTQVDLHTLKDELDVKSLGSRAALCYAIDMLRSRSPVYMSFRATVESRDRKIKTTAQTLELAPSPPPDTFISSPGSPTTKRTTEGLETTSAKPLSPRMRLGEYLVLEKGKKRRKLQLEPQTGLGIERVEPDADVQPDPKLFNSYLGHSMISKDGLFFGDLNNASDSYGDDAFEEWSTKQEFAICARGIQRFNRGTIHFLNRRLRHFFQSPLLSLDKTRVIRYPYPEYLVKPKSGQFASLFTISEYGVSVTKKDTSLIGFEGELTPDDFADLHHSWDHLLSNWPSGGISDEVLPLYDASESELEYSESLLDELEEERLELEQSQDTQSNEQPQKFIVRNVVEEEIAQYREIWLEQNAIRQQRVAWSTWKKAQGRNGADLVNATKAELQRLNIRLERLINEICSESWTSQGLLRKQCGCLQRTVESQLDGEWKLQLWSSAKPPPRTITFDSRPRLKQKPPHFPMDSEGGESLESDSDSLDDFVDIDDVETACTSPVDRYQNTSPMHRPSERQKRSASLGYQESMLAATQQLSTQSEKATEKATSPAHSNHSAHSNASLLPPRGSMDSVLGFKKDHSVEFENGYHKIPGRTEVIDLTMSSPSPCNDGSANELFKETIYDRVEHATETEIASWDLTDLDEQSDRKRIILKLLHSMEKKLQQRIQLAVAQTSQNVLKEQLKTGLGAIKRGDEVNIDRNNKDTVKALCRLFVCWNDGSHRHFEHDIPAPAMQSALKTKDFAAFFDFFQSISNIANKSDPEDDCVDPSPRKKRKNKVLENKHGRALRERAHERQTAHELRTQNLMWKLALRADLNMPEGTIVVNAMKEERDELIFLNPHIAERAKPHQIDGIRFLWREIVTVNKASEMRGCLLAHTMGLGKTMQTISLLVTIAEAAASPKQGVVDQVPLRLRKPQTLILCPAGLIENWKDELVSWIPPEMGHIGSILDISSETQLKARLATISKWFYAGGILIMGYEMFRSLVLNEPIGTSGLGLLTLEEHERVENELLEGPSIVVADEAHRLKQQNSKIARVTRKFRNASRIALTGSPLANNLQDYFAMIDWVAEGYLGDAVEFKARYQEPIEAGTYADSTVSEQRKSLKRLRALLIDIGPKVNRAEISAIQHDLPPKTEIVIRLPLTEWQGMAYSALVQAILAGGQSQLVQSKLFDWMTVLSLLCGHPSIFLRKLSERAKQRPKDHHATSEQAEGSETLIETLIPTEISESMLSRQDDIIKELRIEDILNPLHSFKMTIIEEILIHAKSLNDRVLIFSQYIATLDYLEHLIGSLSTDIKSSRLDGNTKIEHRLQMIKRFNVGEDDVLLISTKAGGLGLNIFGANRVILVDFSFNPMHEEQAVGRAYRMGQQKEVFVYHLVTGGTYEQRLHNTTIFKKQLAARVVDKKSPTRSACKGVVYLFEPTPVEQENLDELKGKDIIMDRILSGDTGKFIRGLQTADTLHKEIHEPLTEKELEEVEQEMIADGQLRKQYCNSRDKRKPHGDPLDENSSSTSPKSPTDNDLPPTR